MGNGLCWITGQNSFNLNLGLTLAVLFYAPYVIAMIFATCFVK